MKRPAALRASRQHVNAINYRGVWSCMKYELRTMREQGSGTTFAMVATEFAEASQVVEIISGEIERP